MNRSFTKSLRLGFPAAVKYWLQHRFPARGVVSIHPRSARHPVHVRPRDSDLDVFTQVFVEEHYAGVHLHRPDGLIVDCGANVGLSAAYFLSRFPAATVIAVEPDPGNFALLEKNLAPYGRRARPVRAAVWPCEGPLQLRSSRYDDGRSWARQVEESRSTEQETICGRSIDSLLAESGFDRISILKMDIEGAEVPIFRSSCDGWLTRTECLAVELHDDTHFGNATSAFRQAIAAFSPTLHVMGEILVADFAGSTAD